MTVNWDDPIRILEVQFCQFCVTSQGLDDGNCVIHRCVSDGAEVL